jgi:hypothetical protein
MKKNYYLLLFVLILSASAKAQTDWVTKKLDEKLSVKFPVEPEKVARNGVDSYLAKGKDSVKYSTTILDLSVVAHLDSATLAPMKDNQEFADQMGMGIASKKTNYAYGSVTIGKWNTYTTYDMSATEKTNKSTLLTHMVLIGSKMYTLSCLLPVNMVTKNNELFFNSVEVLKK